MKVGVIGGGVTGLTAAYELTKVGHRVEVFERAPFLGGQAATFDIGGTPLERVYHHIFVSDGHVVDLMRELGLADRLRWIDSRVGLFYAGRIWNWVTPMDLLRFRPISLWDRLRLGLVTLYLQRSSDWHRFEDVTADEWLPRYVGRRAYQAVWQPLLRGKFGDDYDQVGMTWLWGKIRLRVASRGRGMQREKLGYPEGSLQAMFDGLSRRIAEGGGEVHTSAPVTGVDVKDGKVVGLRTRLSGQGATFRPFDVVVATVPSFEFLRMVELPPDYADRLRAVRYLAALVLVLVLDRPFMPVYWLNVADRSIPFVGAIEHTNFMPPEHYGQHHILYVSNYLRRESPLYAMTAEELLETYTPHLRKINSGFDREWVREMHLFREDGAQPLITTNYSQRIPDHRMPIRGLYLANTTQIYPEDRGVNYSVRLGRDIAALVKRDLPVP